MKYVSMVLIILITASSQAVDRSIVQSVDTATARVEPTSIYMFRGESVLYSVTATRNGSSIHVSTNATARWYATLTTNVLLTVIDVSGTISTNGVAVFSLTTNQTAMAAGTYDSFVQLSDTGGVLCASRSTLVVYKSTFTGASAPPENNYFLTRTDPDGATCVYSNGRLRVIGGSGSGLSASDVTNSLNLAISPSLTGTVSLAAGAVQPGGESVTLARDIKSRDATSVGAYGVAFGAETVAGQNAAAFGAASVAAQYGAAFGASTTSGIAGASFGDNVTVGDYAAGFGYESVAGAYGLAAGLRGKGANGSFVFADGQDEDFDRRAFTNWFSVRASGGVYFYSPTVSASGVFSGNGSGLTGITPGQVGAVPTNTIIRGAGYWLITESGSTSILYHVTSGGHTNQIGSYYTE